MDVKKESFEAWREVIEAFLATYPTDILPTDTKYTVKAEKLQDLLFVQQAVNYKQLRKGAICHQDVSRGIKLIGMVADTDPI